MMQVIVIGQLGELCKKIYELESLLPAAKDDTVGLQIAAYNSVLEAWPVTDFTKAIQQQAVLNCAIGKLIDSETRLREAMAGDDPQTLLTSLFDYFGDKDTVKNSIKILDSLGRMVGNVPQLQLNIGAENESQEVY